ncbi:MAG: autotransporter outer membrane beta-barrel domain-containing protein [Candidatus Levyibacteriota bacterium]
MRTFRPSVAAAAVMLALGAGSANAQYSGAYIFGDSLSDAGQYGSRFTTNPGLTGPMYLAQRYGISVTPSFQGGTDYAQGGAMVNSPSPLIPPNAPNLSIADQVSLQLAKGPLDSHALYQLWGGSNELLALVPQAAEGQITPAQLQAAIVQSATDLVAQAVRLQGAGARYLVVYNVPNVGDTPLAAATGAQATFTALSSLYDSTLNAGIAAAHLQVVQVNTFKLLGEIVANPAAYGFTNVTMPACTTSSSLQCTPATLVDPNAPMTYLFADDVHPTTATAKILAAAAASMLEGPAKIGALAEAPLAVERSNFQAIDGRMMSSFGAPPTAKRFNGWATYDYGHDDVSGPFLSGNGEVNGLHAGGDVRVSDHLLVGAAFGYAENKGDFGASSGGYKLKETSGTAYAGYGQGPWYLGATLGAGDLDYSDVHRNIQLGAMNRVESGETRGWHMTGSVLGGYWFDYGSWLHGPFARLAYQKVHVDSFAESGSDSTALFYGAQDRESMISNLGWQVAGHIGGVRPFARVTWDSEMRNGDRFVSATPVGLNGTYSVPTLKPDSSYVEYVLGASADFGGVTGFLTASTTSGNDSGNGYAITLGLRVPM